MARLHYILTRRADDDLAELTRWSLARWGTAQTDRYLDDLHAGIEWIACHQNQVGDRPHLTADTGLSIYPIREHYVIFLSLSTEQIAIAAFLRQGRDIPTILSKNSVKLARELKLISRRVKNGKIVPDLKNKKR